MGKEFLDKSLESKKYTKMRAKYGLRSLEDEIKGVYFAESYYKMFLDSEKSVHSTYKMMILAGISCSACLVLSFLSNPFLIISANFMLLLAIIGSVNARVEKLWSMRYFDKIFDSVDLEKRMQKFLEKKS